MEISAEEPQTRSEDQPMPDDPEATDLTRLPEDLAEEQPVAPIAELPPEPAVGELPEQPAEMPFQVQKRNALYVQADAVAIGLANASSPYLPIFLTRLGASSTQIGLLTTMPGITGLLFAIPVGRFLQSRRNMIPWFSGSRVFYIAGYTLTGLVSLLLPPEYSVLAILAVWALATIPQTVLSVSFSVVMNLVAGPHGRYELMSRRWSIIGITTAITVALAGQFLDRVVFPLNYQLVFILLSVGGLLSYFITIRIKLREHVAVQQEASGDWRQQTRDYLALVRSQPAFISFVLKRFVFLFGFTLALPLIPLYYVREVHASDAWIGIFSTSQTAVVLIGYIFWARQTRLRGSRFVLLITTFGVALYPFLVAQTRQVQLIAIISGVLGMFSAGVDLVFFDELMKTVPVEYSATFVSLAQSLGHLSSIIAPLLGTFLADQFGLPVALTVATVIRLAGFGLFLRQERAVPVNGV